MSVTGKGTSEAGRGRPGLSWKFVCGAVIPSLLVLGCGANDSGSDGQAANSGTDAQASGECSGAADLEGEQLEIAVPFAAGGGFDRQARVVGDALKEHFGVTPVVLNETGAGGLVSLNKHVSANPKDLRIQYVQTPSSLAAQIAGAQGADFKLQDWPWLAQVTTDPQMVVAGPKSGFTSLEDMFGGDKPARFGATGPGGIDYLHATVLPALFDAKSEVVTGFGKTDEAMLALASGDIDAYVLSTRALLPSVEAGDAVPIAVVGEQQKDAPDAPQLSDIVKGDSEQTKLAEDYVSLIEIGRGFAAVPGAPKDTVDTLSCMLGMAIQDENVAKLFEQGGDFVAYASGEDMQKSVTDAVHNIEANTQMTQLLEKSFQ